MATAVKSTRDHTRTVNQLRGMLAEFGVVVPQGPDAFKRHWPEIRQTYAEQIPALAWECLDALYAELQRVHLKVLELDRRLKAFVHDNAAASRLATIPGVGFVTASALVASVGNGHDFRNGRQFAAWLGLVPRQSSTGGVARLGHITKQGDPYRTRVAKTVGSAASTLFNYDDQKHLLGEYTAGTTNKLVEETVYMGDVPVAVIKPAAVYYVHADYRNTPRQIDNRTKAAVWAWYPQPFGDNLPNSNPSGLGVFAYNLRYPGQYYDSESGFFYNGARYYDPATGRYISSDPLGVKAGINTYSYVLNRPLDLVDPLGLCSNSNNNDGSLSNLMLATIFIQGMIDALAEGGMMGGANQEEAAIEEAENAGEMIPLYRAVMDAELKDIQESNSFNNPYGIENKYFTTDAESAASYAQQAYGKFGDTSPYTIVTTQAPSYIVPSSVPVEKGIPAITIPTESLPLLGPPQVMNSAPIP